MEQLQLLRGPAVGLLVEVHEGHDALAGVLGQARPRVAATLRHAPIVLQILKSTMGASPAPTGSGSEQCGQETRAPARGAAASLGIWLLLRLVRATASPAKSGHAHTSPFLSDGGNPKKAGKMSGNKPSSRTVQFFLNIFTVGPTAVI